MSIERLPSVPSDQWSDAQRVCAEEIIEGPRGAVIEPFIPLLRSPELCTHAQRMGEYLRYRSAIGLRLSELAILLTARHWNQKVEWSIHVPIAIREGIGGQVVEAIARHRDPGYTREDERLVHEVVRQSLENKRIDDPTWAQGISLLGEQGMVDLLGIIGYYSLLSVVMNGAQTPPPVQADVHLPD